MRALRRHIAGRLHLVPRFRQRLAPTPLDLAEPCWEDDPELRAGRARRLAVLAGRPNAGRPLPRADRRRAVTAAGPRAAPVAPVRGAAAGGRAHRPGGEDAPRDGRRAGGGSARAAAVRHQARRRGRRSARLVAAPGSRHRAAHRRRGGRRRGGVLPGGARGRAAGGVAGARGRAWGARFAGLLMAMEEDLLRPAPPSSSTGRSAPSARSSATGSARAGAAVSRRPPR